MSRSIGNFNRHASKDRTQDIVKGVEKTMEHKPEGKGCVEKLNQMPRCKHSQELKGRKGAIIGKSSETLEDRNATFGRKKQRDSQGLVWLRRLKTTLLIIL